MRLIELRQYTHHPGRRDDLITLFEERFLVGQQECGIEVVGTFRDLDRPDCFVWMRAFPSWEERGRSLEEFYSSATWLENRDAANATLIDNDDVLLLREVGGAVPAGEGLVVTVWDPPASPAGWVLQTADVENNFRLPVRTDPSVVAVSRAPSTVGGAKQVLRLDPTATSALR